MTAGLSFSLCPITTKYNTCANNDANLYLEICVIILYNDNRGHTTIARIYVNVYHMLVLNRIHLITYTDLSAMENFYIRILSERNQFREMILFFFRWQDDPDTLDGN